MGDLTYSEGGALTTFVHALFQFAPDFIVRRLVQDSKASFGFHPYQRSAMSGSSSRPPIFQDASTAGIVYDPNGERIVPSTRRPDGTYRKEIKIRPGFVPPEDVGKYRSAKQIEADQRAAIKGRVVGLVRPEVAAAKAAMNKSQKKNEKRKDKRKDTKVEEVADSWDAESSQGTSEHSGVDKAGEAASSQVQDATLIPPSQEESSSSSTTDPDELAKQLKALQKKLRQAEQLRSKTSTGGSLLPEQRKKVDGIADLEKQIAAMSV